MIEMTLRKKNERVEKRWSVKDREEKMTKEQGGGKRDRDRE